MAAPAAATATETAGTSSLNTCPTATGEIGSLTQPSGLAVTESGELVVAESSGGSVSIVNLNSYSDRKWFGCWGSGPGEFESPNGVAVDSGGNILVTDNRNNHIQQFTSTGKHLKTVGGETEFGTWGSGPLEFSSPGGIAVHPVTGKVYVADSGNHRIQVLNSDLTYSSSFGSRGTNDGEF